VGAAWQVHRSCTLEAAREATVMPHYGNRSKPSWKLPLWNPHEVAWKLHRGNCMRPQHDGSCTVDVARGGMEAARWTVA
jgi:hypothetical protein